MIAEIICAEWRKNQAWQKAIKILIAPATAPIFERMTVFEQGETPEEGENCILFCIAILAFCDIIKIINKL